MSYLKKIPKGRITWAIGSAYVKWEGEGCLLIPDRSGMKAEALPFELREGWNSEDSFLLSMNPRLSILLLSLLEELWQKFWLEFLSLTEPGLESFLELSRESFLLLTELSWLDFMFFSWFLSFDLARGGFCCWNESAMVLGVIEELGL